MSDIQETKEIKINEEKGDVKRKKKIDVFSIVIASVLVLAHIAVFFAIYNSYQYYAIYPSIFISAIAIVICSLIILDFIFFVENNNKDLFLKIVVIIISVFILIGGTVGSYFLMKINGSLNNIINTGEDKYELVSGVFTYCDSDYQIEDIQDVSGLRVGFVKETTKGIATLAQEKLDELKIDYAPIETYNNNIELLLGLFNGEIAVAVFPKGYQSIFSADENNDYSSYLNKMTDFYSFEEQVKVEQRTSNKNLSKEPFNVLLIGWSRTDIGSSVGLADAIIVASINPQTYTVSLMSIARDSYVDIPCYGNTKDKINSGRSTSRACFIDTVEQLLGTEMDFYMEIDYFAIVNAVNAIGGIKITNPVEFTLDGQYMPEGTWNADGYQVLQFVRERHHMPNGDFDRQQHQKEVIMAIAKKLIESRDINMALGAFDAASEELSTNLTLKQLTEIFNLILNTKNYTGLDTFDLLDFQASRMMGYASWYYSYSYGFPIWIYKLYNGSIKECIEHMNDVMGKYEDIKQDYSFEFSGNSLYIRPSFSSETFDEKEEHEVMPAFFPHLTNMTYEEAVQWASENGVTLNVEFINQGSPEYKAELDGKIVKQTPKYGTLLSDCKTATITIMGVQDQSKLIPDFKDKKLYKVYEWAEEHYYNVKKEWELTDDAQLVGRVKEQDLKPNSLIDENGGTINVVVYDGYISNTELNKLVLQTNDIKGTKYKDVMDWVNNNLYYGAETNGEVGELLSYSCDDANIKFSSRGCKFNFSDGKKTIEKQYSELTEQEKSIAEISWTDGAEESIGKCSLLYINDELSSVKCSGTRLACDEHETRNSNGACEFVPYSENSATCPFGDPTSSQTDPDATEQYYSVTYNNSEKTSGSCILYTPPVVDPPVE